MKCMLVMVAIFIFIMGFSIGQYNPTDNVEISLRCDGAEAQANFILWMARDWDKHNMEQYDSAKAVLFDILEGRKECGE